MQQIIKHASLSSRHTFPIRRSFKAALDATLETPQQPRAPQLSRAQTARLFTAHIGESPAAFGRRLKLERAAWQLSKTVEAVTDIGFEAGFNSLEVFSRTFKTAFGVSPSHYRRSARGDYVLPSANHIHWYPKGNDLDLLEIMLGHDDFATQRMIEGARGLSDAQLNAPIRAYTPQTYELPQKSLGEMFDRLIARKEIWLSAIQGAPYTPDLECTLETFTARHRLVAPAFLAMAKGVRDTNNWRGAFVDHLCEPPEAFTLGGVIAHVLTLSAHGRGVMLEVMASFGVQVLHASDPIEFVRATQEAL
jgi:AraC family transcriptional regulator